MKKKLKNIYKSTLRIPAYFTGWPFMARGIVQLVNAETGTEDNKLQYSLFPVEPFNRTPPDSLGKPLHWKFMPGALGLTRETQPVTARVLQNVRILGPAGTVIDARGRLIYEASLEICLSPETHSVFNRVIYKKTKKIEGFGLNMSASQSHENYFHWMTDALPKLAIAFKMGYSIDEFDYFIVNSRKLAFQQQILSRLGIPEQKIIALDENPDLHCSSLLVTTATCLSGNVSPWIIDFLRDSFLPEGNHISTPPMVFIGRKNAVRRRLLNETELAKLLETKGFVTVYPEELSFQHQLAIFSNATHIAAVHGAGLTNVAFCSPGTRILEIFPPTYINQGFWTMSSVNSLQYAYLIGEGEEVPDNNDLLRNIDFTVRMTDIINYIRLI